MRSSILGFALMIGVVMAVAANGQRLSSDGSSDALHAPRSPGLSRVSDSSTAPPESLRRSRTFLIEVRIWGPRIPRCLPQ